MNETIEQVRAVAANLHRDAVNYKLAALRDRHFRLTAEAGCYNRAGSHVVESQIKTQIKDCADAIARLESPVPVRTGRKARP